jgi:putative heme-binding domain-containing protein
LVMPSQASAKKVMTRYAEFTVEEKQAALAALATRPADARLIIEGLKSGVIARTEVTPYLARQISGFSVDDLRNGIATHWGKVETAPEALKAEMEKWRGVLTEEVLAKADLKQGRALFGQRCATCHELFGAGQNIGPGLTGSNRGDLGYLLENVIAPNVAIGKDYQLEMVTMKDGQVVSGVLAGETGKVVRIRTLADTRAVEVSEIVKREVLPVSMMPPGLLSGLSEEEVRDLIGYLQSAEQVDLP